MRSEEYFGLSRALAAAALTVFFLFVACRPSFGQTIDSSYEIQLPAGPAAQALQLLGTQTGWQIAYSPERLAKVRTPAVKGRLTLREALTQLLDGANLAYEETAPRAIVIKERATRLTPRTSKTSGGATDPSSEKTAPVSELAEITVTAQKRSENLSRTPLAITALSQEQLSAAGVESPKDLTSAVPDVQTSTVGFADSVQVTIRGVTNTAFNIWSDPAVATYIDGAYVGRTQGLNGAFFDLERVEVLRGPQGTLYGRNSTGGNLNIVTADPQRIASAATGVSFGNYDDIRITGMVNDPVNDNLAVRAAFFVHRNNGYFETDGTTTQNYAKSDDYAGRITALWSPADHFSWRLSIEDFVANGTPGLMIDTAANGSMIDGFPVYHRPANSFPDPLNKISDFNVHSRMNWGD